jgi:protein SCO1/2
MNHSRRAFSSLSLGALAAAGLAPWLVSRLPGLHTPDRGRPGTGSREQQRRYFPNVAFRTQDDRRVRFYDDMIRGKKVLINFMYTECTDTCPRTTANLVKVQEAFGTRLGRDVFFVSISLTPERDTPARLKAYAREQGCREGWDFLCGAVEDVDLVRRRLGLLDTPDVSQHLGILTFGNEPEGKWGATPALASPDAILWAVKSRIDPWTSARAAAGSLPQEA